MRRYKFHIVCKKRYVSLSLCKCGVWSKYVVSENEFINLPIDDCCKECERIRKAELERKVDLWAGRIK